MSRRRIRTTNWRLRLALVGQRIENRLERYLTDREFDALEQLVFSRDRLRERATWLRLGGRLVIGENRRIALSRELYPKGWP